MTPEASEPLCNCQIGENDPRGTMCLPGFPSHFTNHSVTMNSGC